MQGSSSGAITYQFADGRSCWWEGGSGGYFLVSWNHHWHRGKGLARIPVSSSQKKAILLSSRHVKNLNPFFHSGYFPLPSMRKSCPRNPRLVFSLTDRDTFSHTTRRCVFQMFRGKRIVIPHPSLSNSIRPLDVSPACVWMDFFVQGHAQLLPSTTACFAWT